MPALDGQGCVVHPDQLAGQVRCSSTFPSHLLKLNTPFFGSGHLATIACTLFSYTYDAISYTREYIRVPDGGTIAVDITPPLKENEEMDDRPILVVAQCVASSSAHFL